MSRWSSVALGEVAQIDRRVVQPRDIRAGTSYVGLEHIDSSGTLAEPTRVSQGALASAKFEFSSDHVLYGKLRPYLAKIACPDFAGVCSTDILPIRPGPRVDRRYLFHYLRQPSMIKSATSLAVGVNLPRLSPSSLAAFKMPLPPVMEQKRVAKLLDQADALRARRRAVLNELHGLAQSLYLDLLAHPARDPSGRSVALGDLCDAVIDCPHSTPNYAANQTPYRCVRSSDIQEGELWLDDARYVEQREYETRIKRGSPQRGDVIYCREGARFGNAARITDQTTVCLGQRMMLFRPKVSATSSEFVWAFLSSAAAYRQATRVLDGSASPHVNIGAIVKFRVPYPSLALQRDFSRRIGLLDKLKAVNRASLSHLDALFASLQHRAFRGEL